MGEGSLVSVLLLIGERSLRRKSGGGGNMPGINGSADISGNPGEDYLKSKGWRKRRSANGERHIWRHSYYGPGYLTVEHAVRLQGVREKRGV